MFEDQLRVWLSVYVPRPNKEWTALSDGECQQLVVWLRVLYKTGTGMPWPRPRPSPYFRHAQSVARWRQVQRVTLAELRLHPWLPVLQLRLAVYDYLLFDVQSLLQAVKLQ